MATGVQVLVHIHLPNWNSVFKINQLVLVDEIVHFVVHPFDDVVANITINVNSLLHVPLLHLQIEIPGHDTDYVQIMVFGYDLQPTIVQSLSNLGNFNFGSKSNLYVLKYLAVWPSIQ